MITGSYSSTYRKTGGQQVFVYTVSGSKREMELYKETQGKNYREDKNGNSLFFLTATVNGQRRLLKQRINITITEGENPRAVYDDTAAQFDFMNKVEAAMPAEVAKIMAQQWATPAAGGGQTVAQPAAPATTTAPAVTEEAGVTDLENQPAAVVATGEENLG